MYINLNSLLFYVKNDTQLKRNRIKNQILNTRLDQDADGI